jgi:N-acetyl-gamma-glutamyl-phosphate reductase
VPLFRAGLVDPASVAIASASGVTGAGRKPDTPLLFAECNESLRAYGVPQHRHLSEIEQELSLAASRPVRVVFVPHLAPMNRGIHTTIFARPSAGATVDALRSTLANAFANEAFVRFSDDLPDVKNVVGSNFCDIAFRMDPRTGTMVILSAIDNLTKGAAGQAVQCLNLVCGFPENEGLL